MAKKIEVTLTLNSRNFQRQLAAATRSVNRFERSAQTGAVGTKALGASLAPLIASGGALALLNRNFTSIDTNFKAVNKSLPQMGTKIGSVLDTMKPAVTTASAYKNALLSVGSGVKSVTLGAGRLVASFGRLLFSVGALIAGVLSLATGFALLRSSLGTAAQFEDVETVLSNIFGSVEKGSIALESVTKLAEELPFAFSDLAGAAPVLATVSANLTELEENMLLAANIAANFGIPFDQAASSLQRAFSAGAGAADVFREKGVLAAAGFEAGVSVSIDDTVAKLKEFGTEIEGAAEKLNEKFSGAVSQTKDALTLFNAEIGSEAMPFFQSMLTEFVNLFRTNRASADAFAKTIGGNLVGAFKAVALGGAFLIDILIAIKDGLVFLITLGGRVDTIGLIGDLFKDAGEGIKSFADGFIEFNKTDAVNAFFATVDAGAKKIKEDAIKVEESAKILKESGEEIKVALGSDGASDGVTSLKDAVSDFKDELDLAKGTIEEYNALVLKLDELYKTGLIGLEEFLRLQRELDEVFGQNEGLNNFIDTLGSAQKTLSEDLATAFLEGQNAGDAFKNFMKTMITQVIADIMRLMIIQPIIQSIFGAFGMPISFGTGGNIIRGKASGGSVMGNRPYVVGERGPELFVPGQSGTIIPNGAGGGTSVTYNINAVDSQSFQMALAKDPSFVFAVTEAGRRKQPGRI
jgi:hypothetical protein